MAQDINDKALRLWEEKAFRDNKADYKVNDLLERISKETGRAYHGDDINLTIRNLPNSAKRKFIRLAAEI